MCCGVYLDQISSLKNFKNKGAQLDRSDRSGRTVWSLGLAAESGSVDMLEYLLKDNRIDKSSIDEEGLSVSYWAVKSVNIEAVRYLLNIGVTTTTYIYLMNTPSRVSIVEKVYGAIIGQRIK